MTSSPRYLIDTNIVSELRKTKPHGAVSAWFKSVSKEFVAIPALVIGEIQAGAEITRRQNSAKAQEIEAWLETVLYYYAVLPMDAVEFREWARLMVGKSDDLSGDAMIAATARIRHLIVATRNPRDFEGFGVEVYNPFHYRGKDTV
jgi:predicted nucleic acid-binding protein